jgi:hypothetical protein
MILFIIPTYKFSVDFFALNYFDNIKIMIYDKLYREMSRPIDNIKKLIFFHCQKKCVFVRTNKEALRKICKTTNSLLIDFYHGGGEGKGNRKTCL